MWVGIMLDPDLSIVARPDRIQSGLNVREPQLDAMPGGRKQNGDSKPTTNQVLLVLQILVFRDQQFVIITLGRVE